MTETNMILSNPYRGERRPGSVGLPLPGVEIRAVAERHTTTGALYVLLCVVDDNLQVLILHLHSLADLMLMYNSQFLKLKSNSAYADMVLRRC